MPHGDVLLTQARGAQGLCTGRSQAVWGDCGSLVVVGWLEARAQPPGFQGPLCPWPSSVETSSAAVWTCHSQGCPQHLRHLSHRASAEAWLLAGWPSGCRTREVPRAFLKTVLLAGTLGSVSHKVTFLVAACCQVGWWLRLSGQWISITLSHVQAR